MKTMHYCFFLFFLFYVNNSFAAYSVTHDNGTQAALQSSSPNSSPLLLEEDEETAQIHLDAIIKSCSSGTVQRIYSIIKRLNNPACPAKLKPKKMLIIGPSGVGKSTLAQGIARFIGRPCKFIKATDLLTKYQHSGCENLLREVRAVLHQRKPYVIVIDEMNCLIDGFSKETNQDKETATALWLALDECCAREDILFIGTMNESETIPGPIETRFKNHTITIPLPSYSARRNILLYFLRDIDHTITRKNLSELCTKTAGLSGRELEELVTQALSFAYERHSVGACITQKDMLRSLNIIRPHGNLVMQLRYVFSHKKEVLAKAMPYIFPVVLSFIGFAFQYYMWRWQQQPFHEQGVKAQQEIARAEKESTRLQSDQLIVQKACRLLQVEHNKTQDEMLKITKDYRDMKTLALKYKKVIGWLLIEQDRMAFRSKMHQLGMYKDQELKDTVNTCFTSLTNIINLFNKISPHTDRYYAQYLKRNDLTDSTVAQQSK